MYLKPTYALSLVGFSLALTVVTAQNPFLLTSEELPTDDRYLPYIGNGHVATQIYRDTIFVNNVFNRNSSASQRARVPSSVAVQILTEGSSTYTLDMYNGMFTIVVEADGFTVTQNIFAHRNRTRVMGTDITVGRSSGSAGDIQVDVAWNQGRTSRDIDFVTEEYGNGSWFSYGCVVEKEHPDAERPCIYHFYQDVPATLVLEDGKDERTWTFLTSISTDQQDAEQEFEDALEERYDDIVAESVEAWHAVWETGSVTMAGNDNLYSTVNAAIYYLMSSIPLEQDQLNPFGGLSPGSLARGTLPRRPNRSRDYLGHVFWDMDTWMFPGMLMLNPKSAELMLRSRTQVINATKENAEYYQTNGTKFAWEQAYTGLDVCPWPPGSLYQLHVTSDVGFALRQYLHATHDVAFLVEQDGRDLVMGMARYWASRVTDLDEERLYGYLDVMGPDEYHYPVNNSVYTNYNAIVSLQLPSYLRDELNVTFSEEELDEMEVFEEIAANMLILYDEERDYHPQYDGFIPEENLIKQADVVLLGFPLMMNMTQTQRYNDLVIYQNITDGGGPAMSASMYSIAWLELGDEEEGAVLFETMFDNVIGPYKVFSEVPESYGIGATNFITLAGGFLQSVLFGYGGLRLKSYQLDIVPLLLPNTSSWGIIGLDYRGFSLDLNFDFDNMNITLVAEPDPTAEQLVFYKEEEDRSCERYTLQMDETLQFQIGGGVFTTMVDESKIDKCYE